MILYLIHEFQKQASAVFWICLGVTAVCVLELADAVSERLKRKR